MKKVLILAYDFPPHLSIGSKRPEAWYKYFKENNLYPIVITRHWENIHSEIDCLKNSISKEVQIKENEKGTIIRTQYKSNLRDKILIKFGTNKHIFLRKILSLFYSILQYQTFIFDNKKNIYKEAKKYILKNKIDYILVSVEPHIFLRYASKLSSKFKIPWIADYRDEWINRLDTNFLIKAYYSKLEKNYLKNVTGVFSASPNYSKSLSIQLNKKVYTITNGYEKINYKKIDAKSKIFKIGYIGSLYQFQPIETFFKVLNKFLNNNPEIKIEFDFFGTNFISENWDRVMKINFHENLIINNHDRTDINQLYEKLQFCSIVTLFASSHKEALAAKIFDYLYLKKKIILFKNDNGILEKIIKECNAGIVCNDEDSLYKSINLCYNQWLKNGEVSNNTINTEKYSRKEITKRFADKILNLKFLF